MIRTIKNTSFASLFKKYRLRSEISTLAEFGDLLAEEGMIYETSLFTRWQNGERVPKDRRILISIIKVFVKRNGIQSLQEVNLFLDSADERYLTDLEQIFFPSLKNEDGPKILQASLGGLLKDFRTQKNISLKEVSFALGWKDEDQFLKIEQGIEKPERNLIDEICKCLDLKEQEKNHLLFIGNYLPTLEEINKARDSARPIIEQWPFPAVLLDYSWRVLSINQKKAKFFNFTKKEYNELFKRMPRVIEILFHPNYLDKTMLSTTEIEEWHTILANILIHFRSAQQMRTKEKWYIDLISRMMDNPFFRDMWKTSQQRELLTVTKHGEKILVNPYDKKKRIRLYFSVVPFLNDPRFEIEFCNPIDAETMAFFKA